MGDEQEAELRRVLSTFSRCSSVSLDQLDRTIFALGSAGFFTQNSLLGAWVTGPQSFSVVFRHHDVPEAVGYTTEQTEAERGADSMFERVSAAVLEISAADVDKWRSRGGQQRGVVWNTDPRGWSPWPDLPPTKDGMPSFPERVPEWLADTAFVGGNRSVAFSHLTGDMWSSTALINMLTTRSFHPPGPSLRLAGCWTSHNDCAVLIYRWALREETYADSWPGAEHLVELRNHLSPGQRYLEVGRCLFPPSPTTRQAPWSRTAVENVMMDSVEYETSFFPSSFLRDARREYGIFWLGPEPTPLELTNVRGVAAALRENLLELAE